MTDVVGIPHLMRSALCAAAVAVALAILSSPVGAAGQCPAGQVPAGAGRCMPAGATDCGNGGYCKSGQYCSSPWGYCIANGDSDCHNGSSCAPGFACAPGGGCIDPRAPVRSNSNGSGCGSDITGTGGGQQQRSNCGPSKAQVALQRTQRQEIRRLVGGSQQQTTYSYSYGYAPSSSPYANSDDQQVIYEKVKQECGATPTNECAVGIVNSHALLNRLKARWNEIQFRERMKALNGPIEAAVLEGRTPDADGSAGPTAIQPSVPSSLSSEDQTLFCRVVLEKVQSGDLGYSRDEQIPAECRRDQEIIDALKKAKAEHPFITFSGPDTENEITRLLKPVADQDEAIRKQMPPEPK